MAKIVGFGNVADYTFTNCFSIPGRGTGQIHISELPPPASAPAPVTPVPVLVDAPFPVLRAARPSFPEPGAMGAQCFPAPGACFTSQFIKDEAKSLCASGTRPERIPGKGCPIGSPRIDSYGAFTETSASQFDPCRIKDFPVCSGGSRFGDLRRLSTPMEIEYQGIFGVEEEERKLRLTCGLAFVGGAILGFALGRMLK